MRGSLVLPLLSTFIYLVSMVDKSAESASTWNLTFTPPQVDKLPMGMSRNVTVFATRDLIDIMDTPNDVTYQRLLMTFVHSDPRVVRVSNPNTTMTLTGTCSKTQCLLQGEFWLEGLLLGFSNLTLVPMQQQSQGSDMEKPQLDTYMYMVSVIPKPSPLDTVFNVLVLVVICLINLSFGCAFDVEIAKEIFKKPVAILVGFVSQYSVMPALAFLYGYLLDLPAPLRLGLLAIGCSPGGGASNIFSLLLGGDLTLSLCMTFVSNVAALGMMPLWLLTLGAYITGGTVTIPFVNIAISLSTLVVPIFIGMALHRCCPKIAKGIIKIIRPLAFITLIAALCLAVATKSHILQLLNEWPPIVAAVLLPITGFLVGAILAVIARQPKKHVLTIAIETCVQNASVALVILLTSLGQPTGDIAAIMPMMTTTMTQVPLTIVVIFKKAIEKCCSKSSGHYEINANGDKRENETVMAVVNSTFSVDGEKNIPYDDSAVMY